jgi:hypothetical protein
LWRGVVLECGDNDKRNTKSTENKWNLSYNIVWSARKQIGSSCKYNLFNNINIKESEHLSYDIAIYTIKKEGVDSLAQDKDKVNNNN